MKDFIDYWLLLFCWCYYFKEGWKSILLLFCWCYYKFSCRDCKI